MTLTGDTPIGSLSNHLLHSVAAPFGKPLNSLTSCNRIVLERVNRAEPLWCCTEDDGILTSPAVRIFVLEFLGCKECTCFYHISKNCLVGLLIVKSCKLACVLCLITSVINRNDDFNSVSLAGIIVISTETGGCMNTTCTTIHSNVVSCANKTFTFKEGVLCLHIFELTSGHFSENLVAFNLALFHCFWKKCFCYDIALTVFCLCNNVILIGIECNCKVTGESPRCSCPNDKVCVILIADAV